MTQVAMFSPPHSNLKSESAVSVALPGVQLPLALTLAASGPPPKTGQHSQVLLSPCGYFSRL